MGNSLAHKLGLLCTDTPLPLLLDITLLDGLYPGTLFGFHQPRPGDQRQKTGGAKE